MQRAASSKRCARVCAIQGAATEREQPTEREGRAHGRCRFAVDPCRTALRYLCGRGSTASPITATTWGTTPPRIRALPLQIALENSREKNWERRTGPLRESRVAVERATLLSSSSSSSIERKRRSRFERDPTKRFRALSWHAIEKD